MNADMTPRRLLKFMASLKLAVLIILALAVLSAIGTIYEAKFDARYAQVKIYHGFWMYFTMGALCLNLIAVMIDRWPWRRRHAAFVLAHIGIIITLVGAWITQRYGVDGSLTLASNGQTNRFVTLPDTEILVYTSFEGERFSLLHRKTVDFLRKPPTPEHPLEFPIAGEMLRVKGYRHYALRKEEIVESDAVTAGPAIRFQLQNERTQFTQWLLKSAVAPAESIDLGPAKVTLAAGAYTPAPDVNEIVLTRVPQSEKIRYAIHSRRSPGKPKTGEIEVGSVVDTGWMGLQFRVLRFLPQAESKVDYVPRESPTELTTSAVEVEYQGESRWVGLNSMYRFFNDAAMFIFFFGNQRTDVGFDLKLEEFTVGRYQGTMKAMSYQSRVLVDGRETALISMNNPLKYKGYTFYQASFSEDERGKPVMSILSVNKDPGRFLKYLGSLLIVLGSILLFWFKRLDFLKSRSRPEGMS